MCHMLFTRFIFLRRQPSRLPPPPPGLSSSFSFSCPCITSVLLATLSRSLARESSLLLYPNLLPSPLRSSAHLVHVAPPFSLLFLSSLLAAISPRCYPFLSFSRLLQIAFPVFLLRLSFTRYLVDSLLGFARVTLISLPSVSPSRLHSHDAFSAFLLLSRCRPVFSRPPRARARLSFSTCSPLRRDSSVYCVRISFSFSLSFPTRSSCAPFDPRRAVFLPFFLVRLTISLSLSHRRKVYSLDAGPVKNLADPKRF